VLLGADDVDKLGVGVDVGVGTEVSLPLDVQADSAPRAPAPRTARRVQVATIVTVRNNP